MHTDASIDDIPKRIERPVIDADFLNKYVLLVDIKRKRLIIERSHRQLEASILSREQFHKWVEELAVVLLGLSIIVIFIIIVIMNIVRTIYDLIELRNISSTFSCILGALSLVNKSVKRKKSIKMDIEELPILLNNESQYVN
uniref:Uncharacterized protein n=1 Tax=Glossina pallidipes TaxID=7398 RepID=A0A1A9Z4Z4_GLOPL